MALKKKEIANVLGLKEQLIRSQKTYLIKNHRNGYIKIGRSHNPSLREKTLQSEEPELELISVCEQDIEKHLHEIFSSKRLRGEWFCLNDTDISAINGLFDALESSGETFCKKEICNATLSIECLRRRDMSLYQLYLFNTVLGN